MTTYVAPGKHLLIDFYGASQLQDTGGIERTLRDAADACGATVLHVFLHHFGDGAGVTGVAALSESHLSIHTWPETGYVALDIFLCGRCDPYQALPRLKDYFKPQSFTVREHDRGAKALGGA